MCFHPPSPFFRYQHFWSNQGVWKNAGSIIIFPRPMHFKLFLKLGGNHSRPTGADCWPAITQLGLPCTFVFIHHLHSVDANTSGSAKVFEKKTRSIIIFPRSMRFKTCSKLGGNHSRLTGADMWPAIFQLSHALTHLLQSTFFLHPFCYPPPPFFW